MAQLGKALTILARAAVNEDIMHSDVSAFGAPSECHAVVSRGEARRLRIARRHARAVSGLNRSAFNRAIKQVSERTMRLLESKLHDRHNPFQS